MFGAIRVPSGTMETGSVVSEEKLYDFYGPAKPPAAQQAAAAR